MSPNTMISYEKDYGNPNCPERLSFEKRLTTLWEIGARISVELQNYNILNDKNYNILFKYSPAYFQLAVYNLYALAVIDLSALLDNTSKTGIKKFIHTSLQNKDKIFTKEFYKHNNFGIIKIKMPKPIDVLNECIALLNEKQPLISLIKKDRDKIFAHFDENFLLSNKLDISTTYEDLIEALNLINKIINKLGFSYDRTARSFFPINFDDIKQTKNILALYEKHTDAILSLEYPETI